METSQRILQKADEMYMKYGIRSVSMDDLAKALGISKKTIYQHFKDKDTLVNKVIATMLDKDRQSFNQLKLNSKNALDEMIGLSSCLQQIFSNINPSAIFDLQKYYPNAWEKVEKYKEEYVIPQVEDNLIRGINEGLYRKEINIKALAVMRVVQNDIVFNFMLFPPEEFNFVEVLLQFLEHFLRGVVTKEGFEILENTKILN